MNKFCISKIFYTFYLFKKSIELEFLFFFKKKIYTIIYICQAKVIIEKKVYQ